MWAADVLQNGRLATRRLLDLTPAGAEVTFRCNTDGGSAGRKPAAVVCFVLNSKNRCLSAKSTFFSV